MIFFFWMNKLHLLNNKHNTRLKQTGSHLLQNSQQTRQYLQSYNSKPQTATNDLSTTSILLKDINIQHLQNQHQLYTNIYYKQDKNTWYLYIQFSTETKSYFK